MSASESRTTLTNGLSSCAEPSLESECPESRGELPGDHRDARTAGGGVVTLGLPEETEA